MRKLVVYMKYGEWSKRGSEVAFSPHPDLPGDFPGYSSENPRSQETPRSQENLDKSR